MRELKAIGTDDDSNAMVDCVIILDLEGQIVWCNQQFFNLFDLEPNHIIGKNILEIPGVEKQKPGELERLFPLLEEIIAHDLTKIIELILVSKDNVEIPVTLSVGTLKDSDGKITNVVAFLRPITEQQGIMEILLYEQGIKQNIFDSLDDGVLVVNQEHEIELTNDTLRKEFGPAEGKKCVEVFHQSTDPCPVCTVEQGFSKKRARRKWTSFTDHKIYDIVKSPLRNFDDSISDLLIFRDITDQVKISDQPIDAAEKFQYLLNNLNEGVWSIDENAITTFVNSRIEELLGYKTQEMINKHLFSFMDEQGIKLAKVYLDQCEQGIREDHEFEFIKKDGSRVCTFASTSPILDGQGNYQGALALINDITEQKQMKKAFQTSEGLNRILFETSPDGIILVDLNNQIIKVNKRAVMNLGYDNYHELIGKDALDFVAPKDKVRVSDYLYNRLKEGPVYNLEFSVVQKNGTHIPVESSVAVFLDQDERPIVYMSITRDVTDRIQVREALKESEERLRSTILSLDDLLFVLDMNGIFVDYYQPDSISVFDVHPEKFLGKSYTEVLPQNLVNLLDSAIEMIVTSNEVQQFDFPIIIPNDELWFSAKVSIRKDIHNEFMGVTVVARDITDRKKMEGVLIESEERFRKFYNAAIEGLIVHLNSEILDANQTVADMFGYSLEEIIGKNILDLLVMKFHKYILQDMWRERKGLYEVEGIKKDGKTFPIEIMSKQVPYKGQIVRVTAIRDITSRKKTERLLQSTMKDLERSNVQLEQFAYIASHDLKEPLRTIMSYLQLLELRYKGILDEDATTFIKYAVKGAQRMRQLIDDLLTLSRVSSQAQTLTQTDLEAVLAKVINSLQTVIKESNSVITHDPLPNVLADSSHMSQLFQNLIENAIKFSKESPFPRIHIGVEQENGYWIFSVSDNGIGFDPQYAKRIFQIFQRLHDKESYPGTGIGLTICETIVKRHDGQIWAESKPGEGSTFFFTLPRNE